jgi:hypothetical protein
MPTKLYLRAAGSLAAVAAATILFATWRANRRDTAQLAADLALAKQSLAQADARQHDRDKQLLQTLATLAAEKRNITTPAEILRDFPQQIPLPSPITLQPKPQPSAAPGHIECGGLAAALTIEPNRRSPPTATEPNTAGKQSPSPDQAILPIEDLKPLYDFAIDCKACQAKLAAAQADLTDERAKASLLTRERDEAVKVAKGGSVLRRIARNAKWLAIGALAGAVAAKAHH